MIYGCSQPRELWFIDFNHVHIHVACFSVLIQQYLYVPFEFSFCLCEHLSVDVMSVGS